MGYSLASLAAAAATDVARNSQDSSVALRRVLMWVLLLIVSAVVFMLLAFWFRRQFVGSPRTADAVGQAGFTLGDLRRLRAEGKISQDEYEMTRDRIVLSAQSALADAADDDKPAIDAPRTKDVDLIRDAER